MAAGSIRSVAESDDTGGWWRYNRSIRLYGLAVLAGTKLADVVTTAVGVRYVPAVVETNPVANRVFVEVGLFGGLTFLGFATVLFAACAAELFGLEVRRRLGLPKTALCAQASVYLMLSALFGLVALHNAALIADQATHVIGDVLTPPAALG